MQWLYEDIWIYWLMFLFMDRLKHIFCTPVTLLMWMLTHHKLSQIKFGSQWLLEVCSIRLTLHFQTLLYLFIVYFWNEKKGPETPKYINNFLKTVEIVILNNAFQIVLSIIYIHLYFRYFNTFLKFYLEMWI